MVNAADLLCQHFFTDIWPNYQFQTMIEDATLLECFRELEAAKAEVDMDQFVLKYE